MIPRLAITVVAFALLLGAGCQSSRDGLSAYAQGVTALENGQPGQARKQFEEALSADPSLLEAHLNLAALDLQDSHPAAALARLDAAGGAGGERDARLRYLSAVALIDLDRASEATPLLEGLADENFPEAWFLLGSQAYGKGEHADAQFAFEQYLKARPEGGFSEESTQLLADLAGTAAEPLHEDAAALLGPPPTEPVADSTPAVTVDPTVVIPIETPKQEPPIEPKPAVVKPKPTVKPKPKPKPATKPAEEKVGPAERAWRDGRYLEIKLKHYREAIDAYRKYLGLDPLGEHATGAQEGIVRCEAALKAAG